MTLVETKPETPSLSAAVANSDIPRSAVSSAARSGTKRPGSAAAQLLPVSVIIPVRNEAANLPRCLESLVNVGEVYVVDSQSTDETTAIAEAYEAKVVQFHYSGGWPKKRQWAMNTLPFACDWILLLDADEILTPELVAEIRAAIQNPVV